MNLTRRFGQLSFKFNHPNTKLIEGDIRKIKDNDFPDNIAGIIGGSLCQSWSEASAQRGIDDLRGQLFYEYLRILKSKQPKFSLAKNISGMLLGKDSEAVKNIIEMFKECGYNVTVALVNAKYYGVPQEHKRVFYIGFRNDLNIEFKLPQSSTKDNNKIYMHGQLNRASKTIKPQIHIPVACLPTRIVNLEFKPNSTNTVELYMDGGWQFSFRIHNAATNVETSLKFDIQIVGMATTIITINCS